MRRPMLYSIIGMYEVIGGMVSLLTFLDALRFVPAAGASGTSATLFSATAAIVSVLAGAFLLQGRRSGIHLSLIVQSVQLVAISSGTHLYQIILGPFIYIGVTASWFGIDAGLMPRFMVLVSEGRRFPDFIAVNVVAGAFIGPLLHAHRASERTSTPPASPQS